jgi:integrase
MDGFLGAMEMPKLICRSSRLCYLPSRGMAVVYIHGRRVFLGPWPEHPKPPSPEVQAKYKAALVAANLTDKPQAVNRSTMAMLVDKITDWAAEYYRTAPKDLYAITQAAELLLAITGKAMRVEDLGPSHIVACREALVASGRTRQGVNKTLGLIRRILRRGCELGLIPPAVLTGCLVVPGLRPGRTTAPEAVRREGVSDDSLDATEKHLSPQLRAMVRLQRITGMRPNELLRMTWDQIDQSGAVWVYRPIRHKCAWRGQSREILLGVKAQAILKEWRSLDGLPVFSPRRDRPHLLHTWQRAPKEEWGVSSYGHAIARACDEAKVPRWSPQDLRKAAAQEIREEFGLEVAAAVLGHSVEVNQRHYSTHSRKAALEVVKKLG